MSFTARIKDEISNLEKGRRGLSLEQLNTLCNYFKIDMSYFLSENTIDECENLLDQVKFLFEGDELSKSQKEDPPS